MSLPEHVLGDGPCDDCGGENIVWFTDNVFWNAVVRTTSDAAERILCVHCFVVRAESKFKPTGYRLTPEWPWRPFSTLAPAGVDPGEHPAAPQGAGVAVEAEPSHGTTPATPAENANQPTSKGD